MAISHLEQPSPSVELESTSLISRKGKLFIMTYAMHVTPEKLQQLIDETENPLLIDFMADWCGPCQSMAPHLEAFAQARAEDVLVVKVDIDAYPDEAARFMVRSVPTIILLQDGRVLGVHSGALSVSQLAKFVDSNLTG